MTFRSILAAAISAVALTGAQPALAGAFQLNERSTKALGASLSGATSAASDASFAGFNPAAFATVERGEVAGSANLIVPISEGEVQLTGDEVDADQAAVLPALAAAYRVAEDVVLGVTTYAPYGLATDYETDFIGALDAETTKLLTVNVAPTAAWEVTDALSLGAALNVLYIDTRLSNAAVDVEGDAVDVGFSAGLLFKPVEGTQLGLAYHHGHDLELEGTNKVSALAGTPTFDSTARTSLPGSVMGGITQEVTEGFRLMAEGRWFNWDDFDRVDVSAPDAPDLRPVGGPDFSDFTEFQNYEDTFFIGLGGEYDVNGRLTVRSGIAFDESPTTDENRTPRVPDGDRLWLSLGGSYSLSDRITLDASYSYLRVVDTPVVQLRSVPTEVVYEDGALHVASIGGSFRF